LGEKHQRRKTEFPSGEMKLMALRMFPKKLDKHVKEAYVYHRNVESANSEAFDCPELTRVCTALAFAEDLAENGWCVQVEPFNDVPALRVRAIRRKKK
jgi:hypothetical protein